MRHISKPVRLGFIGVVLLVVLIAGFVLYIRQTTNSRLLADSKKGFTYLEPSYLPGNLKIVQKTLFYNDYSVNTVLSFRTVDKVYSIDEWPASYATVPDNSVTTTLTNYDQSSKLPTCKQVASHQSGSFRLCHWIDYNAYSINQVNVIIQGTYITARLYQPKTTELKEADIIRFVGSFKAVNPNSLTRIKNIGA